MVVCNHILGGISEKHEFFLDKIMLNWGSELVFPIIKLIVNAHQVRLICNKILCKGANFVTLTEAYIGKNTVKNCKFYCLLQFVVT